MGHGQILGLINLYSSPPHWVEHPVIYVLDQAVLATGPLSVLYIT